jgi:hypothetical protein
LKYKARSKFVDDKAPKNRFSMKKHVDVEIPQDYKMMTVKENISTEQKNIHPKRVANYECKVENQFHEENLPSNTEVQNALNWHRQTGKYENISIMEDFESSPQNKENERISFKMESLKSSMFSQSSDSFSDYDKMSKGMADIIEIKPGAGFDSDMILKRRPREEGKSISQSEKTLPSPEEQSHMLSMRKPPEEEFFFMTLNYYKIKHKHMQQIWDINAQKLYKKALKEWGPNFLVYPEFIEKELDEAYLNLMYLKMKKKHMQKAKPLTKLQKKQRLRVKQYPEEMFGKLLDDDYDFDDEYFN